MVYGVIDGQAVDQAITNPAFLVKNSADIDYNIIGLASPISGASVTDAQNTINVIMEGVGGSQLVPATAYGPLPANMWAASSTHMAALGLLGREFYGAATALGHAHTGVDGQGPLLQTITGLYGPVTLAASGGTAIGDVGNTVNIYSTPLSASAANSVGSANTIGTGVSAARYDHIHQGIHSVAVSGQGQLFSDVTYSASGGITLAQVGQDIIIYAATAGAAGITSINGLAGPAITIAASGGAVVAAAGSTITVYAPTGGGGGTGNGTVGQIQLSNLEALEWNAEKEHSNVFTDALDNSISTGFVKQPGSYYINGVLMQGASASTSAIIPVWAPLYLNSADKNTTTITNWSTDVDATSLVQGSSSVIGGNSVQWTKTVLGTSSRIKYDTGAATFGIANNCDLWLWMNISGAASSITNIQAVIDIDGTNLETFTATAQGGGAAFVSGTNLVNINLATGGTGSGTGWTSSQAFRYFHAGFTSAASTLAPTAWVNGIFFSLGNSAASPPISSQNYIPLGSEMTIYDNVHRENLIIDAGNSAVVGKINASANLANTYTGGIGPSAAILSRSTLAIGSGQASMMTTDQFSNAVSGAIQNTQEFRLSKIFRSALSSNTLSAFVDNGTPQVYYAASVTTTQAQLTDAATTNGNLLTGDSLLWFQNLGYDDGIRNFVYVGNSTLTANSTWASNQTTITASAGFPAGAASGYYVAKNHETLYYSAVAATGANESFTALSAAAFNTADQIIMYDAGLPLPNPQNIICYFSLNNVGDTPYVNKIGTVPNLTATGTITTIGAKQGQNGVQASWSGSNYLQSVGSSTQTQSSSIIGGSFWVYIPAGIPASTYTLTGSSSNGSNGWDVYHNASHQFIINVAGTSVTGTTFNLGAWNYCVWQSDGTNTYLYLNGSLVATTATAVPSAAGKDLFIGADAAGDYAYTGTGFWQYFMFTGAKLSASQISQVYNIGLAQNLGFGPRIKSRFQTTVSAGQKVSLKGQSVRSTSAIIPYSGKTGIIKTS